MFSKKKKMNDNETVTRKNKDADFKKKQKRISKYKKKELKRLAKHDKIEEKKLKKNIEHFRKTTEWLDIIKVSDDVVMLDDKTGVLGIKIVPPEVFTLDENSVSRWVEKYNLVLNNVDLEIYHMAIDSPIFVDNFINELRDSMEGAEEHIQNIIENEIDNYRFISEACPRKEFFMLLKGNPNDERFMKKVEDLWRLLSGNGFRVLKANRVDFENIFAYVFENDLINDFYFSKGVFVDMGEYVVPYDNPFPVIDEDGNEVKDNA